MKERPYALGADVVGRFDWMRHDLLAVMGTGFFYQTYVLIQIDGENYVWFNRDDDGYLLLNVIMPTTTDEPRAVIEDNFWITQGDPTDVDCPPSGRKLQIKYANGDELRVEFFVLQGVDDVRRRYSVDPPPQLSIPFPLTAVEVYLNIAGSGITLDRRGLRVPGVSIGSMWVVRSRGPAIVIN